MGLNALSICEVIRGIYDDVESSRNNQVLSRSFTTLYGSSDCHFEDLRKAAGNIQKFILREKEMAMGCLSWGKKII